MVVGTRLLSASYDLSKLLLKAVELQLEQRSPLAEGF